MTKILFLDDDPTRHTTFRRNSIGTPYDAVFNYEDAVALLAKHKYDRVYLDHDLSFQAAMGAPSESEKTGYDVAVFISTLPAHLQPQRVVIHSFNPSGAFRMALVLQGCGVRVVRRVFDGQMSANS